MAASPSWIRDYVEAIDKVSEAPIQFNIWAAISVVSSVLKKNVWTKYKTFTIYPNQYIVLVAPPGIGKGTAIHPAHHFAKANSLVNYMSDRVTAPRIIERLHTGFTGVPIMQNGQIIAGGKDASATLMSSELPTLISSSDWMLSFLCDAWDKGEFEYDTRNKGSFTVTDMCVSLIGACVPDYIRKINKDATSTVSSGFTSRTLFINARTQSKVLAWGEDFWENPKYKPIIADLETRLQHISHLHGEYNLDPHARVEWDKWYEGLKNSYNPDDSDVYNNFRARQAAHVLKVAMVLTASEMKVGLITRATLLRAITLVENVAQGLDEIFRGVGDSEISAGLGRIEEYLIRKTHSQNGHGPIVVPFGQILRDNIRWVDHDNIVRCLKILEITGAVDVSNTNSVFCYRWTGKVPPTIHGKVTV